MSTQVLDPTDAAHPRVLDHKVFEQKLKLADALVLAEPHMDHYSPDVLLQFRISLPSHIVLARYVERSELQRLWWLWYQAGDEGWPCDRYPVPGVNLISAHRTYPHRDTVLLTFTQDMAVWQKLQSSQVSRSITFLECVVEDNVVGDLQMTYLLARASRRVNEGPLSIEQFKDDMKRAWSAVRDGKGPPGRMGLTLPQVLFTVKLVNENLLTDNDGQPSKFNWKDLDLNRLFQYPHTAHRDLSVNAHVRKAQKSLSWLKSTFGHTSKPSPRLTT